MNYDLTISSLRDEGYRLTKIRKSIIETFSKANKPLSVNAIGRKLKDLGVSANKTTVYREIYFLLEKKYIKELHMGRKQAYFESAKLKHHHHLICRKCSVIEKVTKCLITGLEKDVMKRRGFKIEKHSLEFFGLCSECLNKTN